MFPQFVSIAEIKIVNAFKRPYFSVNWAENKVKVKQNDNTSEREHFICNQTEREMQKLHTKNNYSYG